MIGVGKSLLSIKKNQGSFLMIFRMILFNIFLDQEPVKEAISSYVLMIMNVSMVIIIALMRRKEESVLILMVVSPVHAKLDTLVMETII